MEDLCNPETEVWNGIPDNVSLKEYYKKYAPPAFYKNLKYTSWALYGVAAVNLVPLFFMPFNIMLWMDVVLVAAMGIGLTVKKEASTARTLMVYAILNFIGAFVLPMDGYLDAVLLGIAFFALKVFHDAKKEYKKLKKGEAARAAAEQ